MLAVDVSLSSCHRDVISQECEDDATSAEENFESPTKQCSPSYGDKNGKSDDATKIKTNSHCNRVFLWK